MRSAAEYVGDAGILLAANVSNAVSNYIDGEDKDAASSSHESSVAMVSEEQDIPTEVATEELNPIDREAKVETEASQPSEEPKEKMEEELPSSQSVEVMNDELHPVEPEESVQPTKESIQPTKESIQPTKESVQPTEPSNPSVPPNTSDSLQETAPQPTSV